LAFKGIIASMSIEALKAELGGLPEVPAADLKKRGWRGVMRAVASGGAVLVTNHSEPEAVIVTAVEYSRLLAVVRLAESKADDVLEALRLNFDERLAVLDAPRAGARLRGVMDKPARLGGRVKAGTGH
jgi:prevent-host-death family protein